MLLVLHILLLGWLSLRLSRCYELSPARLYYWPGLSLRLICGILVGLLYFVYYGGGDTLSYHHDARVLAELALTNLGAYLQAMAGNYPDELGLHYAEQERALLTAKLFSPFYLFTQNNYWITACYFSLFTFLALFRLVHRLLSYRPDFRKAAPLAFLFWPSFVFWSSGLLKETIAIACLGYIVGSCLPYLLANERIRVGETVLSLILLVLLFYIKYYYAALLVPVLASLLLATWAGRKFRLSQLLCFLSFLLLLLGGGWLVTRLHPNLYLERFLGVLVENYYLMVNVSAEGNYVEFEGIQANLSSVLRHAPKAVFSGLYEPFLRIDLANPLRLAATTENALLLLLSVTGLCGWLVQGEKKVSLVVVAALLYVFTFAFVMAIAAPNFGALLRYRVAYLPFFVLLVLYGNTLFIGWLRKKQQGTHY